MPHSPVTSTHSQEPGAGARSKRCGCTSRPTVGVRTCLASHRGLTDGEGAARPVCEAPSVLKVTTCKMGSQSWGPLVSARACFSQCAQVPGRWATGPRPGTQARVGLAQHLCSGPVLCVSCSHVCAHAQHTACLLLPRPPRLWVSGPELRAARALCSALPGAGWRACALSTTSAQPHPLGQLSHVGLGCRV